MFKKILCATDLNETSHVAVKKAVQLAHQYDAKIFMLNVHEEFMNKDEMGMLRVSIDTMKLIFEKTALQAKNEMKTLKADFASRRDLLFKKHPPKKRKKPMMKSNRDKPDKVESDKNKTPIKRKK